MATTLRELLARDGELRERYNAADAGERAALRPELRRIKRAIEYIHGAETPTAETNSETETCWECGTAIEPGHGIIDTGRWAHRSCVGA